MYLAQEIPYATYSDLDVTVNRNTFQSCGSLTTGHAAAMIYSDGQLANNNIQLTYNDIILNNVAGIRWFGPQTNVLIEQNRITGASSDYVGDGNPSVTVVTYTSGPVGYVAP
jgi:hypothetical protein